MRKGITPDFLSRIFIGIDRLAEVLVKKELVNAPKMHKAFVCFCFLKSGERKVHIKEILRI